MNAKKRRILVAVEHTDYMPVSLIHKAAFLAKNSGARVELFHAIADLRIGAALQSHDQNGGRGLESGGCLFPAPPAGAPSARS